MGNQQLTNILAELVKTNALRQPNFKQVTGLSQSILSGVGIQKPYQSAPQNNGKDPRGPSFINRILDVMSRPLYGVLNYGKGAIERIKETDSIPEAFVAANNPAAGFKDIMSGLAGTQKITGRDILGELPQTLQDSLPGPVKFEAALLGYLCL